MSHSWPFLTVLALASLSAGCMTLRDRIALRLGLPTKHEKEMAIARHKVEAPKAARSAPASVFVAAAVEPSRPVAPPKHESVVTSPAHDELFHEEPLAHQVAHHESFPEEVPIGRYLMEKEAARLRWEASLLRLQAAEMRHEIFVLDRRYQELTDRVAGIEADRQRIREAMARLEEEIERAKAEADEMEASWTHVAVAGPTGYGAGASMYYAPVR